MTKNKTNMNRFLTGTLTVAMVATAVAPVASAAAFTDIDHVGEKVKAEIERAVELGYFKDGTSFNPATFINRGQAALTLARHIVGSSDLEGLIDYVEANQLEETVTAFEDVGMSFKNGESFQKELYYASLIVKDADAFTQKNLNPTGKVTRSQMAKIITGAFGLEIVEGFESEITDIDHLDTETKKYIETIASHEVTNVTTFNPAGTVTRSQMASFLVRAFDAVDVKTDEVQSVQPLNTTVDVGGTLTFSVNDVQEAANLEALKEAGYTVEFQASEDVFLDADAVTEGKEGITSTTGKLDKQKTLDVDTVKITEFDYNVVIKKDAKVVAQFDNRQTMKVEKYAEISVSIDEITTSTTHATFAQEIKDGQLALDEEVSLKVKGKVKGNPELVDFEVTGEDATATVEIDRPAILLFNQETGKLTAKAKGTAVMTIKIGEQTKTVTYTVGDARKAETATIDKKSLDLATGQTATVTAIITDQYGLRYTGNDVQVENENNEEAVIANAVNGVADAEEAGKYTFELTAADEEAAGNVIVKAGDVELGTIAVDVKVAKDEIKTYTLTAESTVFDLRNEAGKTDKTVVFKGYDEQGFEVPAAKQPVLGAGYKLASTNEDVVTVVNGKVKVSENAKAGDKVVIEAFKVSGAFEDKVAELEFTVVDTTPQIDDVTITATEAVQTVLTVDFTTLVNVTASSSAGTVAVGYDVNDDQTGLIIVEVDEDGNPVDAAEVLGTVEFSKAVTLTIGEDGKVIFGEAIKGETVIASYIVKQEFKGQVELEFEA